MQEYLDSHRQKGVKRNGYLPERKIQTGIREIEVKKLRVRGAHFTSAILPRYMRRIPSLETLIPALYLKGISTGDMQEAVIADGAYNKPSARVIIKQKKARALIPPPKNARYKKTDDERDIAIAQIDELGGDKQAKSIWAKLTSYSRRALIETAFSRMKGLFGDKLYSRKIDNQRIECRLRCVFNEQDA